MKPTLVFFGGTGDLFFKKLLPSLYFLLKENRIEDFHAVSIGRRYKDLDEYKKALFHRLKEELHDKYDKASAEMLVDKFYYVKADYDNPEAFESVCTLPLSKDYVFYLSTLPQLYDKVIDVIDGFFFRECKPDSKKIVLEKPFGYDENSSDELDKSLSRLFTEDEIYRVDHYLGKEAVQNILVLRSQNYILEKLLTREHVREVRIAMSEKSAAGERASFYDKTGAIKDIMQNHLLQVLSLVAVEIPFSKLDEGYTQKFFDEVERRKSALLEKIRLPKTESIYLGQYDSYKDEVGHDSKTETFVSFPLFIDEKRWKGVPFKVCTGKKLEEKKFYVEVLFKNKGNDANRFRLEFQPREEMFFTLNTKRLRGGYEPVPADLSFNYSKDFGIKSPEAYENVIYSVLNGMKREFPSYGFIKNSWKVVDRLIDRINKEGVPLRTYSDYSICPLKEWIETNEVSEDMSDKFCS